MIGNGTVVMDVSSGHKMDQHARHLAASRPPNGSSGMTSPTPSSVLKMANGIRHHQHPPLVVHQQYGHHTTNVGSQLNSSKSNNYQGPQSPQPPPPPVQTTPTLMMKPPQGLDFSIRDLYVHDTSSQELSRSALDSHGAPLLRTPNPNLTPTPAGCTNPGSSVATTSNTTATFPPFNPVNMRTPASSAPSPPPPPLPSNARHQCSPFSSATTHSIQEVLGSLALLSVISAIVAFLAVLFLTRIMAAAAAAPASIPCNDSNGGGGCILHIDEGEYRLVYDVIIGLTACTISLDFTCLLICCAQFIFTSKLMKSPCASERAGQYLRQSSFTRIVAVGGFFISIPVLLTGIILHAFIQFEAKPAIITSVLLGVSIIFCGLAMVHNVYVWQREKTKTMSYLSQEAVHSSNGSHDSKDQTAGGSAPSPAKDAVHNPSMELSTLV